MLRRAPARSYASRRHGLLDALVKAKAPAKPPAGKAAAPAGKDAAKEAGKAPAAEAVVKAAPAKAAPRVPRPFTPRQLKVDLDTVELKWLKPGPIVFTPSGYVKPLGHTEEIPFQITRTPSGYLPVYRDYRNQRNRILTELRKYTGDVKTIEQELHKIVKDVKVERRFGHVIIHGDWANEVRSWLYRLGF